MVQLVAVIGVLEQGVRHRYMALTLDMRNLPLMLVSQGVHSCRTLGSGSCWALGVPPSPPTPGCGGAHAPG